MNKHFADWYRLVKIEPSADMLRDRWQAIEAVTKGVKPDQVLDLVRLAAGLNVRNDSFAETFMDQVQQVDPTFKREDNNAEMAVLSATALAHIIESKKGVVTDLAALATVAAGVQGLRHGNLIDVVTTCAIDYRVSRAGDARDLALAGRQLDKPIAFDEAVVNQGGAAMAEAMAKVLNQERKHQQRLERRLDVIQEEVDICWWILGEYSRDLDIPIESLDPVAAPVVIGRELAGLVKNLPGLTFPTAVLNRVLGFLGSKRVDKVALHKAVLATDEGWRKRFSNQRGARELGNICPLVDALEASTNAEVKEEALTKRLEHAGVDVRAHPVLAISQQSYFEFLAVRAYTVATTK